MLYWIGFKGKAPPPPAATKTGLLPINNIEAPPPLQPGKLNGPLLILFR